MLQPQMPVSSLGLVPDEAPRRHLNGDGALVAVTFTEAQWEAADPRLRRDVNGRRTIATRCAVRGVVVVEAKVVPDWSEVAPKLWRRVQGREAVCQAA